MTSVVVPCFNEERRILPSLEEIVRFLSSRGTPWEVVVVDDGSVDRTSEVVRSRFPAGDTVRVIRYEINHGKGFAVRAGILASRGELALFSDADLATPIAELGKLETKAEEGFDIVVASRVVPGAVIHPAQPARRRFSGWTFRLLVHALRLSRIRDTQCGFKLLRRSTVEAILERIETQGFAFDVELLARAERAGLRVAEVPVRWGDKSQSRVRLFPDALRMALDLVRIQRRLAARDGDVAD